MHAQVTDLINVSKIENKSLMFNNFSLMLHIGNVRNTHETRNL